MKTIEINGVIHKHLGTRIVRVELLISSLGTPFVRETVYHKGSAKFSKLSRHFA